MARINYLGVEVTPKQESEIVISDSKGLTARVEFIDGAIETFNNLTEIHWLYPSVINDKRVAFESNIHGTGFTYDVHRIKAIDIDTADQVQCSI